MSKELLKKIVTALIIAVLAALVTVKAVHKNLNKGEGAERLLNPCS